ncbi:hypothetical protein ABZT06_48435 [Streptomyces sp. NPDC005483]|uniref:hypothetical protein n=1 Tax=Streptomyces sp. NPDC005483 TaxID=3154882 RepID=UPI0033AE1788
MIKKLKQNSTGIALAATAAACLLAASAGSASAAPTALHNEYKTSYYTTSWGVSAWTLCQAAENQKNYATYGTANPTGAEQYYCSSASAIKVNLWWAHY